MRHILIFSYFLAILLSHLLRPCYDGVMTKKEVAQFLGVSIRTVERYVRRGLLRAAHETDSVLSRTHFGEREVRILKDKLQIPKLAKALSNPGYDPALNASDVHQSVEFKQTIPP